MDRENSCEGMQLLAPKTKQINLIFSGSPVPAPASAKAMLDNNPGKSAAVGLLLLPPRLQTLLPSPDQVPPAFVPPGLVKRVCDRRRNKWHRTGWLLARAGYVSPCCKDVSMVYVLLC